MKGTDWLSDPRQRRPPQYMFLLDSAQTPVNVESNIKPHALACAVWRSSHGWPIRATHYLHYYLNSVQVCVLDRDGNQLVNATRPNDVEVVASAVPKTVPR